MKTQRRSGKGSPQKKAGAAGRSTTPFSYVSSHDLQEPLRKIQTFTSRILEKEADNLSELGKEYFHRVQKAAVRMQTVIEALIAYSDLEQQDSSSQRTDLQMLLREVEGELSSVIRQKGAAVHSDDLGQVHVNPAQFRLLLTQLFSNSLKFCSDKPPRISIWARQVSGRDAQIPGLKARTSYTHITVTDNGIGFDPIYSEKIFEVFQRLHGKEEYEGTGIGLAICRRIVENHKGRILARGAPNEGAAFDIYLPNPSS